MHKLADISTFESLYNRSCGAVFNSGSSRIPYLANISLFEGLMVHNEGGLPMTRERYNQLKEELRRLEQEELPAVREQVAAARAEGDLSENAEYHAAREKMALIQAKIDELKDRLARAQIIDAGEVSHDEVRFGATVTVTRLDTGEQKEYTLVGYGDDDPSQGRIAVNSPLGKAFLGAKEGGTVTFTTPSGKKREYHIDKISYGGGSVEGETEEV